MISHKLQSVTTFTNTDITLNPVKHHFRCSRLHFKNFEVPEKEKTKTIRSMYFSHFTYQWCVGTECLYANMTYTAVMKDGRCRGSVDTPNRYNWSLSQVSVQALHKGCMDRPAMWPLAFTRDSTPAPHRAVKWNITVTVSRKGHSEMVGEIQSVLTNKMGTRSLVRLLPAH